MNGYVLGKADVLIRLRKIEGQVRGIQRLVAEDTYCIDVLTQIASAEAALRKVALGLVDQHLRDCVLDAITTAPDDGDRQLHEATLAVERLLHL